jgi:hypothetical protein
MLNKGAAMLIQHDIDEWEGVSEHRTCPFHKEHPGQPYAGCTCMSGFGLRRRDPAEVARIKAERRRKHEEDVLAEAAQIMALRGMKIVRVVKTERRPFVIDETE